MGGAFVDLQLEGSDGMLRGTMSTFIGSRVSRQAVRGTFDAEQATVALRETEARPPARFELTLQQGRLVGSVVKATGARGPLELGRP